MSEWEVRVVLTLGVVERGEHWSHYPGCWGTGEVGRSVGTFSQRGSTGWMPRSPAVATRGGHSIPG